MFENPILLEKIMKIENSKKEPGVGNNIPMVCLININLLNIHSLTFVAFLFDIQLEIDTKL